MFEAFSSYEAAAKCLLPKKEFRPFPKYEDREAWDAIPEEFRQMYLNPKRKEYLLSYNPPSLTGVAYLNYYRGKGEQGDTWGGVTGPRRDILFQATIAECLEGKGEFIDKIIDLLWLICEETSWVVPPHNNHMHNHMWSGVMKNALPDIENLNFVDLYAGVAAACLGWTYYFLKDVLDKETPLLCRRIEYEIDRHIVTPFMTHDDLTWFGFYGHKINNWVPWILSNIIPVCLMTIRDEDRRIMFFARALEKFDIYLNNCTPDGACDEGPGYWNAATAAAMDAFEGIKAVTGGAIDVCSDSFVRRMCEYVANNNMGAEKYANFADAGENCTYTCSLYHYAELCDSGYMKRFAAERADFRTAPTPNYWFPYRVLSVMFSYRHMMETAPTEKFVHRDTWYPDGQLLFVRSSDERASLAAKGGYNNESHNHNDVGSFIYLLDGETVFCDPGALFYTARAFSPFRYCFWITNSDAHNCVRIGDYQQHNGDEYKAEVLDCTLSEETCSLTLEMAGVYEAAAGVFSHVRAFVFDKKTGRLSVTDTIKTKEAQSADVHFLTRLSSVTTGEGCAELVTKNGKHVSLVCGGNVSLEYHDKISSETEHVVLPSDSKKHGEATRIVFSFPEKATERTIHTEIFYKD